jgi:hypothetical protein
LTHYALPEFWERYHALPRNIRELADEAFARLKENPRHPSLQFKKVDRYWSERVGQHYRALAEAVEDGYVWIWIGSHEAYNRRVG